MGVSGSDSETPGESAIGLTRRGMTLGLGLGLGLGVGLAGFASAVPAVGQTVPLAAQEAEPPVARLAANLLTRMVTATRLNDSGGFQFVIDTGAGRTAIAQDVAEALDLAPGPPVLVHGVTSAEMTPTVRLGRLTFGKQAFRDIVAPVFPRALLGADGLLGLDVLSRFELRLNLTRRTVTLAQAGPGRVTIHRDVGAPSRLSLTPITRARQGRFGQLILVDTRVESQAVQSFVDSGAQYSIGNRALQRALASTSAFDVPRATIRVQGVTGQMLDADRGQVRQLQIGSQRLGSTPLLFADLHAFHALDLIERPSLLIGADILYRFSQVSLDFAGSSMIFQGLRRPPRPVLG